MASCLQSISLAISLIESFSVQTGVIFSGEEDSVDFNSRAFRRY